MKKKKKDDGRDGKTDIKFRLEKQLTTDLMNKKSQGKIRIILHSMTNSFQKDVPVRICVT